MHPTEEALVAKAALGQPLTDREKRIAGLKALGWTDRKIATRISTQQLPVGVTTVGNDTASAIVKLGLNGPIALALWAVDNAISPQRRAEWTDAAVLHRETLRKGRVLDQARVRLLMMLTDPMVCDLSGHDLGQLCDPTISHTSVNKILAQCWDRIGANGSKIKLAVVLYLAPLGERQDSLPEEESEESL